MFYLRWVFIFFVLLCSFKSFAKIKIFEIAKEDTPVYVKPSFDSKIIVYIKQGKKLYGSDRLVTGVGGFGLFYKVRLKKGLFGYILDTSVKGFTPSRSGLQTTHDKNKTKKKSNQNKTVRNFEGSSIPYSRAYGLVARSLVYKQKFSSGVKSSNELMYGLALSGPGWFFQKLAMDINLLYSPSSPKLFDDFTQENSGNILMLDVSFPVELRKESRWSLYGLIGASVLRYDFDYRVGGENFNSSETSLGLNLGFGGGYRFGRYFIKLTGNYFKFTEDHYGLQLSIQRIK